MGVFDGLEWETWAVAALAGLVCMLLVRSRLWWQGALLRLVMLGVAAIAVLGYFHWTNDRDMAAERRAIQARQADLTARALVPGSPLACLNGDAGESIEAACEKALFATPETAAAAVAYVAARLTLLSDALQLDDEELAPAVAGLRRMLTLDRYGIAAHVLATRDGCNVETCAAFTLVEDPTALKANLKTGAFDAYVQRHEAAWKKTDPANPAVAVVTPPAEAAPPTLPETAPAKPSFSSRYDFPSSDSIPAVSIMNKEPPRPPEGAPTAAQPSDSQSSEAPPAPHTPVPLKRPQTQGSEPR